MTASEYNYLLALNELSKKDEEGVRIVDLAEITRISKASVYHALNRLINKGLASRSLEEATYNITEEGKSLINSYVEYVSAIKSWLVGELKLDGSLAYDDAIQIACNMSDSGRDALLAYINK